MSKFKIGYFADGPWSHQAFKKIIDDPLFSIQFVCGRYGSLDNCLMSHAKSHGIPFVLEPSVNDPNFLTFVADLECDLFVSMSFDQIFGESLIKSARLGTINCHAGKLPFYRGRNVINWALINDEKEIGITVHFVDEGIDTGDIILQQCFPISDKDDYASLLELAYCKCADMLYESLLMFLAGPVPRKSQSSIHPHGSYCRRRKPGDEFIDWKKTSREIFNFVRALAHPGPQARSILAGKEVLINRVQWIDGLPKLEGIAGSVLARKDNTVLVKTADTYLSLTEFTSSKVIKVGDRFDVK